ncbi:sensor histidine kinase [Fusobacterium sp. SYSU M8A802]
MKKISKELYKSYFFIISIFFISYIGLLYFFISYIIKDTDTDILSIDSFIRYEVGEFEKKLSLGKSWDELFYGALEECPKMPNTFVIFKHNNNVYTLDYIDNILAKLEDSKFSDQVQRKKFFTRRDVNGNLEINISKFLLFNLPDFQYLNREFKIPNQEPIQILIIKKLSQEKRILLRIFRISIILISITTFLSIVISKRFYRDFTSSLTRLQDITNKINLVNLNKNIKSKNKFIEFDNITNSYNQMLERLKEQTEAQIDFVNNASHELKTPIFIINSYVNMIKRWGFERKDLVDESLTAIYEETNNMANLVTKLLFLAKDDSNSLEISKIDILMLFEEIKQHFKVIYPKQTINIFSESFFIYSDRYLFKQLLFNLVENAIKYGSGKIINIRAELDKILKIEIIDNGIGISNEDLEHIYDRFFRVDKGRSRKLGSHGLGLSIVKKICALLKIDISIESEIGKGTKVTLSIPINNTFLS